MNKTTTATATRAEKIITFLDSLKIDIDFANYISDIDDITSEEELQEELQENQAFDVEIIYYANAIEYLKEYDQSLSDSIEIALEYGYTLENINSEILASLLASQNLRDEYQEKSNEIEEFFNELSE